MICDTGCTSATTVLVILKLSVQNSMLCNVCRIGLISHEFLIAIQLSEKLIFRHKLHTVLFSTITNIRIIAVHFCLSCKNMCCALCEYIHYNRCAEKCLRQAYVTFSSCFKFCVKLSSLRTASAVEKRILYSGRRITLFNTITIFYCLFWGKKLSVITK